MRASIKNKTKDINATKDVLKKAKSMIIFDYQKLSANNMNELRSNLLKEEASLKIIKKNTIKRSLEFKKYPELENDILGPNGYIFSFEDELAGARVLANFASANKEKKIQFKSGIFNFKWTSSDDVKKLATLPNREGLLSMLLSCLQEPTAKLARTLKALSETKETQKA